MANKKKSGKPISKASKSAARKSARANASPGKVAAKKKPAPKKAVVKKKAPVRKTVPKKLPAKKIKTKVAAKKSAPRKVSSPGKVQNLDTIDIERRLDRAHAGVQSGDLQGLSRRAGAASESVDELLEEGNAYEAGIVQGIEDADEADENEVLTHEVPADDVPEEYLDED